MANKETFDYQLQSGLKIRYSYDRDKTDINLKMLVNSERKTPSERKEATYAMHHLLEHCIRIKPQQEDGKLIDRDEYYRREGVMPKEAYTKHDHVEHSLKLKNLQKLDMALDCFGELFSDYELPRVDCERERIYEEWAIIHNQPDKWKFLGNLVGDKDILSDEEVSQNKDNISQWLNHQADYTKDFSREDIDKYARFAFGADNLVLEISGAVPPQELMDKIKNSKLTAIPPTSKENPLHNTNDAEILRQGKTNTDYNQISMSKIDLSCGFTSQHDSELAWQFLKPRFMRGVQRGEPYAYDGMMQQNNNAVAFECRISSPKQEQLSTACRQILSEAQKTENITDEELTNLKKTLNKPDLTKEQLAASARYFADNCRCQMNGKERLLNPQAKFSLLKAKLTERNQANAVPLKAPTVTIGKTDTFQYIRPQREI